MNEKQLAATNLAIERLGGITKAAEHYDISVSAVQQWRTKGVPKNRVKEIEADTGVAREDLLPDLYG